VVVHLDSERRSTHIEQIELGDYLAILLLLLLLCQLYSLTLCQVHNITFNFSSIECMLRLYIALVR
jgi:hypothetical protein